MQHVPPSSCRAWLYLVGFSFQRQARTRQMVWIALALLGLSVMLIALNTAAGRWSMGHWRSPRREGPQFNQWLEAWSAATARATAAQPLAGGLAEGLLGAHRTVLEHSGFLIFSQSVVYTLFLSFLLPIWCLSFASEALGGERESGNLIWLLTRPIARPAIYLAKFVAFLPWSLGFSLGGFGLMCLAAGAPGQLAFERFWPAVLAAAVAFSALFYLMSTWFRRPAVMAIAYCFFLEIFVGNMPGTMKRLSIGFYTRCLMYDSAGQIGVLPPQGDAVFEPVSTPAAWSILLLGSVVCLLIGMLLFSRSELKTES